MSETWTQAFVTRCKAAFVRVNKKHPGMWDHWMTYALAVEKMEKLALKKRKGKRDTKASS